MLHVIVGEDTYRSRAAFRTVLQNLSAETPYQLLAGEALTEESLSVALTNQSLFSPHTAVALEGIARWTGKKAKHAIAELTRAKATHTLIVWEEGIPDARSSIWKFLHASADTLETFHPLSERELLQWVFEKTKKEERDIDTDAAQELVRRSEGNMWQLAQDLEKVLLFSWGRRATRDDVLLLVPSLSHANIFSTVRALATGDTKTALRNLSLHRHNGEESRALFSLTIREVRLLLVARDLLDRGSRVLPADFARSRAIPLFAAEQILRVARTLSRAHLQALHDRLLISFFQLNSGRAEVDDILDLMALSAPVSASLRR